MTVVMIKKNVIDRLLARKVRCFRGTIPIIVGRIMENEHDNNEDSR